MFLLWKGALSSFRVEVIQEGIVPWSSCCLEEIASTCSGCKMNGTCQRCQEGRGGYSEKDNSTSEQGEENHIVVMADCMAKLQLISLCNKC